MPRRSSIGSTRPGPTCSRSARVKPGRCRVATYQSIGARVLPAVMRRFLAEWPGINLGLSEPSADPELYTLIESGEIDLAFCSLPVPEGPFEAVELMTDPYVLLVPSDTPLAKRTSASLLDLGDMALIGANLCASGNVVDAQLSEAGLHGGLCLPLR